ncbi:hypothetical protein Halxa_3815 [Halopiger xanaduensis SH-6]|uniref:Uncharacterized protein n=2 Tax=Halopiger TaxID=387342 RepID=F8DCF9_HALXS|nr:hypothetical protein Halxa_3815 [Halopiger xanaduensis SH-6]RKD95510.1 hypothetical protein ATJ93_2368 [Halopiger aswanensis]
MIARCPDCDDGLGEQLDKYVSGGETIVDFECPNCGHEWSLSL